MKVYIVTSGDYSDYHIEKVFTNREQARLYAMLNPDREVEEYTTDTVQVQKQPLYITVRYDYRHDKINALFIGNEDISPHVGKSPWLYDDFEFTISTANERVYKNILRYGKKSSMLKKIVQDTFAAYLYEHQTSREYLIQEENKRYEEARKGRFYVNYTTSADVKPNVIDDADLTEYANRHMKETGTAPTLGELLKYAADKTEGENNETDQARQGYEFQV